MHWIPTGWLGHSANGYRHDPWRWSILTNRLKTHGNPTARTVTSSHPLEWRPWTDPLLRWAGSKRPLLPRLAKNAPRSMTRYIEPFAGSACLFFALRPPSAVLGDINSELIATYATIRRNPRLVARAVRSHRNTARTYDRLRRQCPEHLPSVDRAARFVFLNRHCFNGVYRENRQGQFNVPRGRRTGNVPSEAAFYRNSVALRVAELRAVDFEECLSDVQRGDFVYLDPPYASVRRPTYGEYGYNAFGEADVERLLRALETIDRRGAMFLLSYCNTRALKRATSGWSQRSLRVRRHVAGFAKHRRVVRELLVSNQPGDLT